MFIDEGTPNADAAMRSADEACYAAKHAGRNRVQEYELGDARMMRRRGVMEWVTQLDKAIDDGRLILNCQRIAPVPVASNGSTSHYEILLTMRKETYKFPASIELEYQIPEGSDAVVETSKCVQFCKNALA